MLAFASSKYAAALASSYAAGGELSHLANENMARTGVSGREWA